MTDSAGDVEFNSFNKEPALRLLAMYAAAS